MVASVGPRENGRKSHKEREEAKSKKKTKRATRKRESSPTRII